MPTIRTFKDILNDNGRKILINAPIPGSIQALINKTIRLLNENKIDIPCDKTRLYALISSSNTLTKAEDKELITLLSEMGL